MEQPIIACARSKAWQGCPDREKVSKNPEDTPWSNLAGSERRSEIQSSKICAARLELSMAVAVLVAVLAHRLCVGRSDGFATKSLPIDTGLPGNLVWNVKKISWKLYSRIIASA